MEKIEKSFKLIVKNEDTQLINDFLIDVKPDVEFLKYFDYLVKNTSKLVFEKLKLNLVYILGEIGKFNALEKKYVQFLKDNYFNSDRWIRYEIIQALDKLSKKNEISGDIINILAYSLLDDYDPIKIFTLKILNKLKSLPNLVLRNLIRGIDNSNQEIVETIINTLKIYVPNGTSLFNILDYSENYKFLKKNSIRSLLTAYFNSIKTLEIFRKQIFESKWQEHYKNSFYREIDTFINILSKR